METKILSSTKPLMINTMMDFDYPDEYMTYLYFPVQSPGSSINVEKRLEWLYNDLHTLSEQLEWGCKYVYVTVKNCIVPKGSHQNRPGFHSDGFGTDDVNVIWFDCIPTEVLLGEFKVSNDDVLSLKQMDMYGNIHSDMPGSIIQLEPNKFHVLNENHIHRTSISDKTQARLFIKITASDHIYNQSGNSINYALRESWNWPRQRFQRVAEKRNQPHS